jgi:Spy/CpxP family protein refolding chaperone
MEGGKMENKLAKIVAVLTMVGLMSAGPVVYAASEGDNPQGGQDSNQMRAQGLKEWKNMTPAQRAAAQAQYSPQGQGIMAALNLTPEQSEAMMAENKTAMNPMMMEQMKAKSLALNQAIAKPGATREGVNGLIVEMSKIQTQMLSQMVDHLFAIKKILTPEQLEKFMEMNSRSMGTTARQQQPQR